MPPTDKIVISASRRTDIPAFYMVWFMEQIKKGFFKTRNPFNQKVSIINNTPDKVHTIVFWSKNFEVFIKREYGQKLQHKGYNLFFNFTINSESKLLEPNVPPLNQRLKQLDYLSSNFGSESINFRFDPVCFFKTEKSDMNNNLHDFKYIVSHASQYGIKRCITSFMDHYKKIKKRTSIMENFSFIDPPLEKKINILLKMEKILNKKKIQLLTCCEKELVNALPPDSGITNSSCIPNDLLMDLFGGKLSLKKDTGQRVKSGCGCKISIDIGSYHLHPCYHNCLFCYANPVSKHYPKSIRP